MILFNLGGGKNSKDPQEQSNLFSHLKLISMPLKLTKMVQNISAFLKAIQKEQDWIICLLDLISSMCSYLFTHFFKIKTFSNF